ncbi:MAG: HEAT repeat domain-containing protein [Gemmatimonadota bacterium]
MRPATGFALALLIAPSIAQAQRPLAERLRAAGTRTVAFSARTRPEVCGDGKTSYSDGLGGPNTRFFEGINSFSNISYSSDSYSYTSYDGVMLLTTEPWDTRIAPCEKGPLRAIVRMVDGTASWIKIAVGPLPTLGDTVQDLGTVSAAEAGAYFQALARAGDGRTSSQAFMPLILLDSTPRWQVLESIAKDSTKLLKYRRRASDLLARAAANTLPPEANTDEATRAIRREAVNGLVRQRDKYEDSVPTLLDIAKSNPHRDARVAALYQLGQSSDPRAVELFSSMLRGKL